MNRALCMRICHILVVLEGLKTSADTSYVICIFQWLSPHQICENSFSLLQVHVLGRLNVQSREVMNHLWRGVLFASLITPRWCSAFRSRRQLVKAFLIVSLQFAAVFKGHLSILTPCLFFLLSSLILELSTLFYLVYGTTPSIIMTQR